MDHPESKAQQFRAHLAIAATEGAVPLEGAIPSPEELALLLEDRLDFTRRREVLSHLNANHELYTRWLQLVDAAEVWHTPFPQVQTARKRGANWRFWFRSPVLQGALVASLLLTVVGLPLLMQTPEPTGIAPSVENAPPYSAYASADLDRAIVAGVTLGFHSLTKDARQQLSLAEELALLPLPHEEEMAGMNPLGIQLGESLLLALTVCRTGDEVAMARYYSERLQPLLSLNQLAFPQANTHELCQGIEAEITLRVQY
jgi:hypothetical protein